MMSADGVRGLEYLTGRGVTEEAIQTFRLGYAPDSWEFLTTRLSNVGADLKKAGMMGLVGMKENEGGHTRFYDRYRGRVVFPIIDQYGNVAGFGGRVMGEGEPKYLNSPESQIYHKRSILYGYNLAKQEIAAMKRAIVVEGYLDVIGCHQAGVRNVVAPLGTALTEEQVKLLSRQCEEIILLFDADSAGLKASIRSLDVVKEVNVKAKVATLPEDDPFDFVTKRGVREFLAVVDSALPPVDFLLAQVLSNIADSPMDKLVKAFEIVKEIEYDTERTGYLRKIASALRFDGGTVTADYEKFARSGARPVQTMLAKKHAMKDDFLVRGHRDLLVLVIHYPELVQKAVLDFSSDDFDDPVQKKIFKTLSSFYGDENSLTMDKLFDILKDEDEKKFFSDHLSLNFSAENPDAAYTEIYLNIRQHICDRKISYFADLIKHEQDPDKARDYLIEIDILRREKEAQSTFLYNFKKTPASG
jgi:DNA primase